MNVKDRLFKRYLLSVAGSLATLSGAGLLILASATVTLAAQPAAHSHHADITVYKTAQCGCCDKWADQLKASGLDVATVIVTETNSVRSELGVPHQLGSCHTAVAGDYWVEGHVPIDLVNRLLDEQPENIRGIAVPGMPAGSPGMESPAPVNYQVLSVDNEGKVEVYAVRKGKTSE